MLIPVRVWPNRNLAKPSPAVTQFDDELKIHIADMVDTCRVMFGAGLAAPQIGVRKRIVVIQPEQFKFKNPMPSEYNPDYLVMINPVIELSGDKIKWEESCLSIPGVKGIVERYESCKVTFLDEKGATQTIDAPWPFSGGIQHEVDHLDGILYTKGWKRKSTDL